MATPWPIYPPLRVEILMSLSGVEFAPCYKERVEDVLEDAPGAEPVSIISLACLKQNKSASGRHKDRERPGAPSLRGAGCDNSDPYRATPSRRGACPGSWHEPQRGACAGGRDVCYSTDAGR